MKEKFSEIMLMGLGNFGVQNVKKLPQTNFSKFYINIKSEMIGQFNFDQSIILDSDGFGYDSNLAHQMVLDYKEVIKSKLANVQFLFLFAGLGGATGSGAIRALAQIAKELNIITIAVVVLPNDIEWKFKEENSKDTLDFIVDKVDSLVVISGKNFSETYENFQQSDLDKLINNKLQDIVEVITDTVIQENEVIPINLSLMKSALKSNKHLYVSQAIATGGNDKIWRSKRVANDLFANPAEQFDWKKFDELLISISASETITQLEIKNILDSITSKFDSNKLNYSYCLLRRNELANDIKAGLIASEKRYNFKESNYPTNSDTLNEFDLNDLDLDTLVD